MRSLLQLISQAFKFLVAKIRCFYLRISTGRKILSIFKYNRHFVVKLLWPSRLPLPLRVIQDRSSIVNCRSFEMVGGLNHWQEFKDPALEGMFYKSKIKRWIHSRKPLQIIIIKNSFYTIPPHQIIFPGPTRVQLCWSIGTAPYGASLTRDYGLRRSCSRTWCRCSSDPSRRRTSGSRALSLPSRSASHCLDPPTTWKGSRLLRKRKQAHSKNELFCPNIHSLIQMINC